MYKRYSNFKTLAQKKLPTTKSGSVISLSDSTSKLEFNSISPKSTLFGSPGQ